jgi:hypothetical protein
MGEARTARDLARAVLDAIELARQPGTAARCRAHAAQWSRDRVGRLVEETYAEMVAATGRKTSAQGAR